MGWVGDVNVHVAQMYVTLKMGGVGWGGDVNVHVAQMYVMLKMGWSRWGGDVAVRAICYIDDVFFLVTSLGEENIWLEWMTKRMLLFQTVFLSNRTANGFADMVLKLMVMVEMGRCIHLLRDDDIYKLLENAALRAPPAVCRGRRIIQGR